MHPIELIFTITGGIALPVVLLWFLFSSATSKSYRVKQDDFAKRENENVLRLQSLYPGYGHCLRCGLPWAVCDSKTIQVTNNTSIFALCSFCWDNSDHDERLCFYSSHYYRSRFTFKEDEYNLKDVENGISREEQNPGLRIFTALDGTSTYQYHVSKI